MPFAHIALALSIVLIWGLNFIFVRLSLDEISPLLLCGLRFFFASIPAIFFIKRPAAPFLIVASYGLVMFALQFALLFKGMSVGMTPGMASILIQVQIFFSMFFAAIFLGEKITTHQLIGALVSSIGIVLVGFHIDRNLSVLGFVFVLAAAGTWGVGNLITKKLSHVSMISMVVWGSFVAAFPIILLSLWVEGPEAIVESYQRVSWVGGLSLAFTVCFSTWIGYAGWGWLISRYPVGMIVPFTLLVPIVGMLGSVFVLDEPLPLWKIISGVLVLSGLYIHLFCARFFKVKTRLYAP
ncbi:MAG: EamA family transporter [Legionellales bacterium]|nr:EamA family transporter [Legionellales bacterium]